MLSVVLLWGTKVYAGDKHDSRFYVVAGDYDQFIALDRYHRAFDADDMEANAIYALRTTLVRELLDTRQELKYFIGGEKRAREVTKDKDFTFKFFDDTCQLYVEGCYPEGSSYFRQAPNGQLQYVKNPLYDIHEAIDDLYSTKVEFDQQVRNQLILGLIQLSALLTRFDRLTNFYRKDVWQYKDRLPLSECSDSPNQDYLLFQDSGRANCLAKLRSEAQKIIEFLQFYRAKIIDNYHLLIFPISYRSYKSLPLYQHIYKELEKIGFPAHNKQLTLIDYFHGLPRHKDFEKEQNLAYLLLTEEEQLLRAVAPQIDELIDIALFDALKANSDLLKNLGKEIHYLGDDSEFLKVLTCDQRLWKKAQGDFSYLEATIDFDKMEKKLSAANCPPKQRPLEKIATIGQWLNGGLVLLDFFPTKLLFGKENKWRLLLENENNKWLRRGVMSTLITTGSLEITNEFIKWSQKKPQAIYLADNFRGNSYDRHSEQEFFDDLKKKEFFRLNSGLTNSIILGAIDISIAVSYSGKFSDLKTRISEPFKKLREGRKLRRTARYLVSGNDFYSKHPHLDRVLQAISLATPFSRRQLDGAYLKFTDLARKIFVNRQDGFGGYLQRQMFASLTHLTAMQAYLHESWDDAKRNWNSIAVDFLSSIFFGVFIAMTTFGKKSTYFEGIFPVFQKKSVVNFGGNLGNFFNQFLKNSGIGLGGMLLSQSALKLFQSSQESRSWEDIFKLAAYGMLYIAIISNIRSNFIRQIEKEMKESKGGGLFHVIVHQANSAFGQWLWIVLKEDYKELTGIGNKTAPVADQKLFLVKEVVKGQRPSQLFDFIGNKDGGHRLPDRIISNF